MAEKKSIYIGARLADAIGGGPLSERVNSIGDRYSVAMADLLSQVLPRLDDANRRQIRVACTGWASHGQPAETLIGGIAAEVADAADGGDLDGEDVRDTLAKLDALSPAQELALIEWVERGHAGAS
ncbi:hypothetical protein [Chromobacterium phragmitis]|uniref:hypothetical protein n=1 Tax=Chromobacterium phragmitis TaxID=2202141 RepID=UPI0038779DAA